MSAFDIREAPPTAAASGYRCALVRWLARHKGRPAPCGTADDYLRFVPWERKTQNVCVTPPGAAGLSRYRVWAVPES